MKSSLIQHVYAVYADDADQRIQVTAKSRSDAVATGARLFKCKGSEVVARYVKSIRPAGAALDRRSSREAKRRLARQGKEQWDRRLRQVGAARFATTAPNGGLMSGSERVLDKGAAAERWAASLVRR